MESTAATLASERITFVIFTFNEEKRIHWAAQNFLPWGRVLVVDNYSEDRTVEIARSLGCDVLLNKNEGWGEEEKIVLRVKAAVQTEWIYWAFADEMADATTLRKILEGIASNRYSIINIARKNYYYGRFCYGAFADRMNRIFKKDAIDFTGNTIHRFGTVTVPEEQILYLDMRHYYVHHFNSYSIKSYLRTMGRYTDIEAAQMLELHPDYESPTLLALMARSAKVIVVNYFVRGGYKAGFSGLAMVLLQVWYRWMLAMKCFELREKLNLEIIEDRNDQSRSKIVTRPE